MPYEMHTVRAADRVFTQREVKRHVFGKNADDFLFGTYLGTPPLSVRRLLGDNRLPESAQITRLARGRRTSRRSPPSAARPSWRPRVVAQDAEVRRLRPPVPPEDDASEAKRAVREASWAAMDLFDRLIDRVADWFEPFARRLDRREDPLAD
jgi:hypothetical protein